MITTTYMGRKKPVKKVFQAKINADSAKRDAQNASIKTAFNILVGVTEPGRLNHFEKHLRVLFQHAFKEYSNWMKVLLDDIKNEYEQIQKNSIKNDFEGIMFYSTGIVPPVGNKIDILSATLCELKETIHEYYRSKFGFNN